MIRLLAAAVLLLPLAAAAQGQQPRDRAADLIDFGADKNKQEAEVPPPAPPQPGNLIRYDIGRPTSMTFYVDSASVSLMQDGVIRFTSVAKGEGSSQNVAYEGMRCDTREYKTYAYGKADGTWYVLKEPQWRSPAPPRPWMPCAMAGTRRRSISTGTRRCRGGSPRRRLRHVEVVAPTSRACRA